MRSTEILSRIGQDFSRTWYNNATSLEVLNDPNIKEPKSMTTGQLKEKIEHAETFLRQDLHDVLATERDLVTLLHLAIKDFPVTKQEIEDVTELIQPDELKELPKPLQPPEHSPISCSEAQATNEYFSQINTNQTKRGVYDDGASLNGISPFDWHRNKGDLNYDNRNN